MTPNRLQTPGKSRRPAGRPGKKNPEVCQQIIKAARTGIPLKFAAAGAGITEEALRQWREKDPKFAEELEVARLASVQERWEIIQAAARGNADTPPDWKAAAWSVERTWPKDFGRPEIQLAVQTNVMTNGNNGGNGLSLESVVVGDLEFLGLAKKEGYQHRSRGRSTRDIEVSVVAEEVSGTLVRTGHPRTAMVSESQDLQNQRRMEKSEASIEKLLADKFGRVGRETEEPEGAEPERPNSVDALGGTITLPTGLTSASWWRQFCEGNISRMVARDAANWLCGHLLGETFGAGQGARIQFDADASVAEVIDALERVAGPRARQMLMKKAGLN